jgi:hypothetical protein
MNLKLLSVISTSVAVFAIVMLLTRGCDKPETQPEDGRIALLNRSIQRANDIIRAQEDTIIAIRKERQTDSLKHLEVTKGLKMREVALVRKLKAANADIQVIADSLPKVARYIELADSTIAVKDSLYTQEVNHGISTEALYKSEIAAMADKYVKQVQVSEELTTVVTDLTNENSKLERKLTRKKTGNRLLLGIAGGLAAAIGVMTLTN